MGETRWAQVARDLAEGIAGGSFPVGSLLPTELELCDRYGASRHTVRSAIRELQDLGLVSRRKKVGTRVEAAHPSAGYQQSLASIEDLVQFGASHRREVQEIESVIADRALAKTLGCEAPLYHGPSQPAEALAWPAVAIPPVPLPPAPDTLNSPKWRRTVDRPRRDPERNAICAPSRNRVCRYGWKLLAAR